MMEMYLRQARHEKGFSIRELSRQSGIARSTIEKIEKNDLSPRIDTLCILAATLGVALDDLVQIQ